MEYLPNGYTMDIAPGAFPLSTDSMVLAHFVRLSRNSRIVDLGSGCATLGLLLCAKSDTCQVAGIELDEKAHNAALENIHRNGLSSRLSSICCDLRQLPREFAGQFDCCVSNPPYFSGGNTSRRTPVARHTLACSPEDLFMAAARLLNFGGDFYLVQKPERLAELITLGSRQGLEAKRLLLVRHRQNGPVILICLHFRKGGKPGLTLDELSLYTPAGEETEDYRKIYHIQED